LKRSESLVSPAGSTLPLSAMRSPLYDATIGQQTASQFCPAPTVTFRTLRPVDVVQFPVVHSLERMAVRPPRRAAGGRDQDSSQKSTRVQGTAPPISRTKRQPPGGHRRSPAAPWGAVFGTRSLQHDGHRRLRGFDLCRCGG
jgi:hypothetical protein